ncbi:MAG TPA: hypothetical protein VF794_06255 [Archangium sp.]|uniref:SitA5 family polymorphic toxin n=1 Tax=Archangium sp. TaxID=1872627 RepID=UPI002EDB9858
MSTQRSWWGGWVLILLFLHSACATGGPRGSSQRVTPSPDTDVTGAVVYEVAVLEPGRVSPRSVPMAKVEFQSAVQRLARDVRLEGTPQEAARALLKAHPELEGEWLAEVSRGRVLTLVPVEDRGPLTPEADAALRVRYLRWCEGRGGGDCLGLFEDGPYLRTDDRRTLALALAFGSVLDETREALVREVLDPRALVAMVVWTVALYCALWLVPEPTTKAVAASLTVILVAWLGVDTLWGLMEGWARMANAAHEATTFAELREAGEQYAQVLGTDAARAMILAVATLTGRTLGEVAARVRSLPGYGVARARWEAQGGAAMLGRVEGLETAVAREGALAVAVETVVASPQGPLAVVMFKKGQGGWSGSGLWRRLTHHRSAPPGRQPTGAARQRSTLAPAARHLAPGHPRGGQGGGPAPGIRHPGREAMGARQAHPQRGASHRKGPETGRILAGAVAGARGPGALRAGTGESSVQGTLRLQPEQGCRRR